MMKLSALLLLSFLLEASAFKVQEHRKLQSSVAPSESPAPSPSPSAAPTHRPTGTYGPTPFPSFEPTESPAPSPSPTSVPSLAPSPSPSQLPSQIPSYEPSRKPSQMPSQLPSAAPTGSVQPSLDPTLSLAPSGEPTGSPSQEPSALPSITPTVAPSVSPAPTTTPTTGVPSSEPSNIPSAVPTVDAATLSTIISVTLNLHDPLDAQVRKIFEQQATEFIETQLATDMPTYEGYTIDIVSLKIAEQTWIPARRKLVYERELHAAGLRIRFNVTGVVTPGNLPEGFSFAHEVGRPFVENYNTFIYRLYSVHETFIPLVDHDADVNGAESGVDSVNGKASSGAVVGIVIASVGSIALAVIASIYAVKMRQRHSDVSESSLSKFDNVIYPLDQADSQSTMMTPYNNDPVSPKSLESGARESRVSFQNKSLLDNVAYEEDDDDDLGQRFTGAVLGAHANAKTDPPARPSSIATNEESLYYSDDDATPKSVELTPHSGMAHLGARPMSPSEQEQFRMENGSIRSAATSSVGNIPRRTGLYDVFAPSGPLGIVVDTTRDGPVVHSMKSSSPLLGLISAGDLIVGLDDMDTRSMTAATLTRLMAKRSHQAERKITLLAIDGGSTVN